LSYDQHETPSSDKRASASGGPIDSDEFALRRLAAPHAARLFDFASRQGRHGSAVIESGTQRPPADARLRSHMYDVIDYIVRITHRTGKKRHRYIYDRIATTHA
jgi:hypothetical protein